MEDKEADVLSGPPGFGTDPLFDRRSAKHRIAELEFENARLQKLVAELLLKNQQLRKPD
jgi:hypothetical protein